MDSSPPGPSVHRILQARILEWAAISFSSRSRQARWTLAPPANVRKDAGAGGLQGIQEASAGKRAPQAQGTGDRAWGGGRCATETLPATTPGTERLAPATVAPGKDHLEVRVLNQ